MSIGPIAILILNQSINCGFRNGAMCGIGAATADLTYAIVAFTAGSLLLPLLDSRKESIPIISSVVLIVFSIWMIYTTLNKNGSGNDRKYTIACKLPFITTYGLTIVNPLTIIVFAGYAGLVTAEGHGNSFVHAIVIFIASLSVQLLIALAGSKLAIFFSNQKTLLYFNLASSLGIMIIGISKLL